MSAPAFLMHLLSAAAKSYYYKQLRTLALINCGPCTEAPRHSVLIHILSHNVTLSLAPELLMMSISHSTAKLSPGQVFISRVAAVLNAASAYIIIRANLSLDDPSKSRTSYGI